MPKCTTRKTRRRSAGEGSVYQVPDGRWRGSVSYQNPDKSTTRRYVSGATSAEARQKLDAIRRELSLGTLAPAGQAMTVADHLDELAGAPS